MDDKKIETENETDVPRMLAMFGAWDSGKESAVTDTRPGAVFRGAMAAADAVGLTEAAAAKSTLWRACRSAFISGYVFQLETTHPNGVVTGDGKVLIGVGLIG